VTGMANIYPHSQHGRNAAIPANHAPRSEQLEPTGTSLRQNAARRRIGFVGFDGVRTLDLAGPLDAFTAMRNVNSPAGQPSYQLVVIGLKHSTFVSESGVTFRAQESIEMMSPLDTI